MPPSRAAKVAAKSPKRVTFGVPHMEWDAEKEAFERIAPRPPPKMQVKARLMEEVHSKYGVKCQSNGPMMVSAVTDTGCQTSSAGVNMLRKMGIPERYLIPTCHRIIGITDTNLKILGAVFLEIECNDRVTRQMVHISTNSTPRIFLDVSELRHVIWIQNCPIAHIKMDLIFFIWSNPWLKLVIFFFYNIFFWG